jgi:RNA polymerase sigma factor (sigma-70 family)
VTEDDLIGPGEEGLVDGVRRHDEAGAPLEQYVRYRIRGVILDSIRVEAFQARVTRAGIRASDEILKLYRDDFDVLHHDAAERQRRLDRLCDDVLMATLLGEAEEAQKACAPEEQAERAEHLKVLGLLRAGRKDLPAKMHEVLVLLFEEGRTQEQAAEMLHVDVVTVWRRYHTALGLLRKWLHRHGIHVVPDPVTVPDDEGEGP